MSILLTTVNAGTYTFNDLAGISVTHPTSNVDLEIDFSIESIRESAELEAALSAGDITIVDNFGRTITSLSELDDNQGLSDVLAIAGVNDLTEDLTPSSSTDFILIWDDSAGDHKKVRIENLPTGGGGGDVATDTIWDTAGDLAIGSGANTAVKLAVGASGFVLTSNGVGVAPSWQAAASGTTNLSLGTLSATTVIIESDTGTNVTLIEADTANAGLLGSDKWDEIVANTAKISNIPVATDVIWDAAGDLVQGSGSNTAVKLSAVSTGNALISGGVGVANSWGKIGLTTHVSGTLPVANGGTGITSLGAGIATFLGTPTSANLIAAVTDETGTGALVFATSPTLVTPILGTPTSGTATNLTGLPLTTGTTGVLPVNKGGTNISSYTVGDILYASGTTTLTKLAAGTSGTVLTSNGAGVAPSYKEPRISSTATTTDATSTLLDAIDTLTDPATHIIEVFITARETGANSEWGVWKRTLAVTNFGGTVTVQQVSSDMDKQSTGLKANDVSFAVNGTSVNINVTGIAATTIDWDSKYEIISVS